MEFSLSKTDPFFAMLESSLQHVSHHAERCDNLAYEIYKLLEGNDPEEAAQMLNDYGYTDENGEWIYNDE